MSLCGAYRAENLCWPPDPVRPDHAALRRAD